MRYVPVLALAVLIDLHARVTAVAVLIVLPFIRQFARMGTAKLLQY
jgi:hypothetical protein